MRTRSLLLFGVAAGFAFSTTACSSLTKPDEIAIAAEPIAAAPKPMPAPAAPAAPAPMPAGAPGTGG